jgi:hypothetical protein
VGNIGSAEIVATVEIQKVKELHVRRTGEITVSIGTTVQVMLKTEKLMESKELQ